MLVHVHVLSLQYVTHPDLVTLTGLDLPLSLPYRDIGKYACVRICMVAYFMITNLVMLWYCSVSTESTFLFVLGTGIVATDKD